MGVSYSGLLRRVVNPLTVVRIHVFPQTKQIMPKVEVREYRGYFVECSKLFFNVILKDETVHSCRSMTQAKRYIDALIECGGNPDEVWDKHREIECGEW